MIDVRRHLSVALLLGLGGLAPAVFATAEHRYRLSVDPLLRWVTVRADLDAGDALPAGVTLAARDGDAARLRDLAGCDGGSVQLDGDRIRVPAATGCVRYRHELGSSAEGDWGAPRTAQDVRVTAPGEWLWLPRLGAVDRVLVTLDMPSGMRASVP